MNEQQTDQLDNQNLLVIQSQAILEFERWVNESNQIDSAYTSGKLGEWIEKKLQSELNKFGRGQ